MSKKPEASDVQFNSFEEVREYLDNHESDIQNGLGANAFADLAFSAFSRMQHVHGVGYPIQFSFMERDQFTQMTPVGIQENFARHIYDRCLDDPVSFNDFLKKQQMISQRIEEQYNQFNTEIKSDLFKTFVKEQMSWWEIGIIGEDKGRLAHEDMLSALSKRGIEKGEAEEALSILVDLDEVSELARPKIDEIKIRRAIHEGKDVESLIREYIDKYFFYRTTLRDREVMTPELLKQEFSQESNEEIVEQSGFKKRQKVLEEKLNLSTDELRRISYLRQMVGWVDKRRVTYMKNNYYFFDILHRIADQFRLPYDHLAFYTIDEVVGLLKTKKYLSAKELKARENGFFIVYESNQPRKFFYGNEAKELLATARQPSNVSYVEGMVASRGDGRMVTGRVRIIHSKKDNLLKSDEILVTSMTRPEFIKYMKNAAAIVTDEGGIACHAAIVSREMGKLCVIGTKIATQVFKDGDMVEVNVTKGVVKKI